MGAGDVDKALHLEERLPRFAAFKSRQRALEIEGCQWMRLLEVGSVRIDEAVAVLLVGCRQHRDSGRPAQNADRRLIRYLLLYSFSVTATRRTSLITYRWSERRDLNWGPPVPQIAQYDVVIVGCGPAGFSACLAAVLHKLRFVMVGYGGTVAHFPRGKLVMTAPAPAKLRLRLGEGVAAAAMSDLAKRRSLGVREFFGGRIFVRPRQFLVHRPRDAGQDARPIHNGSPCPDQPRR